MVIFNRFLAATVLVTMLGFVLGIAGTEWIYAACTTDAQCESILVSFGGN